MPLNFWFTRSTVNEWLGLLMLLIVAWMRRPAVPPRVALIVAAGPLICGAFYCVMAIGRGWFYLPVSDDPRLLREFYILRYVDWIFIVPPALYAFLSTALADPKERNQAWVRLLVPSLGMTVSALLYSAWVGVILKTLFYFLFFGFSIMLALTVRRIVRQDEKIGSVRYTSVRRDVRFLAGLWACYNITVLLGSDGIRFFLPSVTTAFFENLDFALAVAYPFVALSRFGRTREALGRAQRQADTIDSGPGLILRPSASRQGAERGGTPP